MSSSWMHDNLGLLGNKTLRQICMPGSHDAGMSEFKGPTVHTLFASPYNTLTQDQSIIGQLQFGVRFFDIRPVIGGLNGDFETGHYGYIDFIKSWQGANGQSIASIVDEINRFTTINRELIILELSHDLNTNNGNNNYTAFNSVEWKNLFEKLKQLNNLFNPKEPPSDLTKLTLNDFIQKQAAVVVIVPDKDVDNKDIDLTGYSGFYHKSKFPYNGEYSNTNDFHTMANGQLAKLGTYRPYTSTDSNMPCFMLFWTLTQQGAQVLTTDSIKNMANLANPHLEGTLLPVCASNTFPNIILIDNVTFDISEIAMKINTGNTAKLPGRGQYFVGDWTGDHKDKLAVLCINKIFWQANIGDSVGLFYPFNSGIVLGNRGPFDQLLVGDWTGDGKDKFAVRMGNKIIYQQFVGDPTGIEVVYGNGQTEDQYLVGDWTGDGKDKFAVRRGNIIILQVHINDTIGIQFFLWQRNIRRPISCRRLDWRRLG